MPRHPALDSSVLLHRTYVAIDRGRRHVIASVGEALPDSSSNFRRISTDCTGLSQARACAGLIASRRRVSKPRPQRSRMRCSLIAYCWKSFRQLSRSNVLTSPVSPFRLEHSLVALH